MAFDLIGKAVKQLRLPTVNYNSKNVKVIPAHQGDVNSRYISIVLFDDRGNICLDDYTRVSLNATLPDGQKQNFEGNIDKSTNSLVCKIAGTMLSQVGRVACDVSVFGEDNTCLTSQTFYILVLDSQFDPNSTDASDEVSTLGSLIQEVQKLEDELSKKVVEASEIIDSMPKASELISDWNQNDDTKTSYIKNKIPLKNGSGNKSIESDDSKASGGHSTAIGCNSQAVSFAAHSEGKDTSAGARGYYIKTLSPSNMWIMLTATEEDARNSAEPNFTSFECEYEVGDVITIALDYEWIDCCKIVAIAKHPYANAPVITVDHIPEYYEVDTHWSDKEGVRFVNNTIRCSTKPHVGIVDVGLQAHAEGEGSAAVGQASHAEGKYTKAEGALSHTEGLDTIAAYASHAEGRGSKSLGKYCHAEGRDTIAGKTEGADCAHAEGKYSKALAEDSHAEGYNVIIYAEKAHGEGVNNTIKEGAAASHIEGGGNTIEGTAEYAHAEGISNTAKGKYSHVEGNGTIAAGEAQHVQGRFNKEKDNVAFIIGGGSSNSDRYNIVEVDWSGNSYFKGEVESGGKKLATEEYVGSQISSIPKVDLSSYATKDDVKNAYIGAGRLSDSKIGTKSTAEGRDTTASAGYSHAEGYGSIASGQSAHAEGEQTWINNGSEKVCPEASGRASHVEGFGCKASREAAHAEGYLTVANRPYTHAEGFGTLAGYDQTIVDQYGVSISDDGGYRGCYAHAEGINSKALNYSAHAEGTDCIAFGNSSHAGGSSSHSIGVCSFAHGLHATAKEDNQFVIGTHNADNSDALFIVGNGKTLHNKSNAFEVISDGEGVAIKVGNSILRENFIADLVANGLSVKIVPVAELPAENVEENAIYLLPSNNPDEVNVFDEYIYTDGVWERLGSTGVEINLDDYVKKTDSAVSADVDQKIRTDKFLSPYYIDRIVKVGITTNTFDLTDEERATAQSWLGIDTAIQSALNSIGVAEGGAY